MRLAALGRMAGAVLLALALGAPAHAADDDGLLVFAAASLKNAMDGVVSAYEAEHDVNVKISYAGSSTLARQIEQGAPADIYVSANQEWMDTLEENGLIEPDLRVDLLANSLVLIAPKASPVDLDIAPDFAIVDALGHGYLAMANTDAVPAGIYGRQALQSLHVWSSLEGHIAQANDVRAALRLVDIGEAPLGVVYASDAVADAQHVRVVDTFPADSHDPIVYPAAIVQGVDNPRAEQFMVFLQSDGAARIFRKWGFTLVKSD